MSPTGEPLLGGPGVVVVAAAAALASSETSGVALAESEALRSPCLLSPRSFFLCDCAVSSGEAVAPTCGTRSRSVLLGAAGRPSSAAVAGRVVALAPSPPSCGCCVGEVVGSASATPHSVAGVAVDAADQAAVGAQLRNGISTS